MISREGFKRLLSPASIAVIGGRAAEAAIRECRRFGYAGDIWPVNPKRAEMAGLPCYGSLDDLPGIPDAAFLAINADLSIEAVSQLAAMGCGGVVCYASGFKESGGDGIARQEALVEVAGDMPVIGPNCYGVLNALDGVALWPDQHGCQRQERGVAIVTQSGNIGLNMTMQRRGLPLAYMIAVGNQAQVGLDDCVDMLLDDPRVTAIGLHIEGLDDLPNFDRVARRALEKKVPILALKAGRSETGAKLAMSHTSSMAGSDQLYDAMFDRLGIARLHSVTAFLETLKLLSVIGPLTGNRIASMSCSGGEASLMADLFENRAVRFTEMDEDHCRQVQATLSEMVSVSNPLDYHTFIWGDEDRLAQTFSAMMAAAYDATMLVLDWPSTSGADFSDWNASMRGLIRASQETGHKAIVVSSMPECQPSEVTAEMIEAGVVPMVGLDDCAQALDAAYKIGMAQTKPVPAPMMLPSDTVVDGTSRLWDEARSKAALQPYGLPVPKGRVVASGKEAEAIADELGYPVVVKAVGEHLAHKSDQGGVHLNLRDGAAVSAAVTSMGGISDRYLVEKMVPGAVAELIIGVSRDEQFGLTLLIGAGGILVELLKDSVPLTLPVTRDEAKAAVSGLRIATLLNGYRGAEPGDIEAVIDSVMAIAAFVADNADRLLELDVNPLLVMRQGEGVIAVDALIRMVETEQGAEKENV